MSFEQRIARFFNQFRFYFEGYLENRQQFTSHGSDHVMEALLQSTSSSQALNFYTNHLVDSYLFSDRAFRNRNFQEVAWHAPGLQKYLRRSEDLFIQHVNVLGRRAFTMERSLLWGSYALLSAGSVFSGNGGLMAVTAVPGSFLR